MTQLKKRALISIIARFFNRFSYLVLLLIAVRFLSKTEIGQYKQVLLFSSEVVLLFTLGLDNALTFFLPSSEPKDYKKIVSTVFIIFFCIGIFILFLSLSSADFINMIVKDSDLGNIIGKFFFLPFLFFLNVLLIPLFYGLHDQDKAAYIEMLISVIFIVSAVVLLILYKNLNAVLISISISESLKFIFLLYSLFKKKLFSFFSFNFYYLKRIFIYSLPLAFSNYIPMINRFLDKIIISIFYPAEIFAVFGIGAVEIPLVKIIPETLGKVLLPEYSKHLSENNYEKIKDLWKKSAVLGSVFLYPVMIFFIIWGEFYIRLFFSDKFASSTIIFRIYLFVLLTRVVNFTNLFKGLNATKFIFINSVIMLSTNIGLNILFLKRIGFAGPAAATVVSMYVGFVYKSYVLKKLLNMSIKTILPWRAMFKIFLFSAVSGLLSMVSVYVISSKIMLLILSGLIFTISYLIILKMFDKEMYKYLFSTIELILKRKRK